MKKTIGFLVLCAVIITACEKDDFCTQNPVTPKLILRFYDDVDRTLPKSAESLYVWAENKDSIFVNIATDSLVLPLNGNTRQTIYNFSKDGVIEKFTINYNIENEYVSRSCGFKINFFDVSFSPSNNWITDLNSIETTLENQDAAHVQVFH
ncbi:DUF6452 family protein [Polaribacter sp.]|uniref:DUF6452 family protein n=1 Tax=Polaribacter sp. TaxID=1920175 RepID=UPI003F6B778D